MKRYNKLFVMILLMTIIGSMAACSDGKKTEKESEVVQDVVGEVVNEEEPMVEETPQEVVPEEVKPEETKPEEQTSETQKPAETKPQPEQKPAINPALSKYPYHIKVNRLANCVTIYTQDESGAYTVPIKAMVCSVGNPTYKTPAGTFKTSDKYTWRYLYGNQYGQYATRITGSILFHSVPYSAKRNDALKTNYYNNLGVADSMGCVRLTCADAKWIYDNCPKGTTVEIYEASDPGPLGKPAAIKIDVNSPYAGWDPTDPNTNNPWRSSKPSISGVTDLETTCGSVIDLLSHVSAKDWLGNRLEVTVSSNVDFTIAGVYQVTYRAIDSVENISEISAKVVVREEAKQQEEQSEISNDNEQEGNQGEVNEE